MATLLRIGTITALALLVLTGCNSQDQAAKTAPSEAEIAAQAPQGEQHQDTSGSAAGQAPQGEAHQGQAPGQAPGQ